MSRFITMFTVFSVLLTLISHTSAAVIHQDKPDRNIAEEIRQLYRAIFDVPNMLLRHINFREDNNAIENERHEGTFLYDDSTLQEDLADAADAQRMERAVREVNGNGDGEIGPTADDNQDGQQHTVGVEPEVVIDKTTTTTVTTTTTTPEVPEPIIITTTPTPVVPPVQPDTPPTHERPPSSSSTNGPPVASNSETATSNANNLIRDTPSKDNHAENKGLDQLTLILIIVGVVAFLIIVIAGVIGFVVMRKKKKSVNEKKSHRSHRSNRSVKSKKTAAPSKSKTKPTSLTGTPTNDKTANVKPDNGATKSQSTPPAATDSQTPPAGGKDDQFKPHIATSAEVRHKGKLRVTPTADLNRPHELADNESVNLDKISFDGNHNEVLEIGTDYESIGFADMGTQNSMKTKTLSRKSRKRKSTGPKANVQDVVAQLRARRSKNTGGPPIAASPGKDANTDTKTKSDAMPVVK